MKTGFITCLIVLIISPAIWSQNAPVTSTGRVTNANPGDPAVPVAVTVSGFTDIGGFTLTMKFDTTRVRYVSSTVSPALPGMAVSYVHPSGNTQGRLILSWSGASNMSLEEGSSIAGLVFHYVTGTGNLTWAYTFGQVCQYRRWSGSMLVTLNDYPKYLYYQNGGISYRGAPSAVAPIIQDPVTGALPVAITVNDFNNINAFTLYLEYDPAIIAYQNSFIKNPAFDSNFIVGDNPGSGGKKNIVIQWYGSPVNLSGGETLCTLNFNYPSATCNACLLKWFDSGPTCQYSEANGDVLIDSPKIFYYSDGIVAAGLPVTWTGSLSNSWYDPGNWTACGMPDATRNVVIPNVSPAPYPVIYDSVHCKSINIETGATLTVSAGGSLVIGEE
jgi:hypothetical protein